MKDLHIYFWKGHHSPTLLPTLTESWSEKCCVIICPPYIEDTSYLYPYLPTATIHHIGSWTDKKTLKNSTDIHYPQLPILGVFTTGTTRQKPKLVMYSKKNLTTTLDGLFSLFDKTKIKFIFSFPQPYHAFGLILGYIASLHLNCKLIMDDGPTTPISLQYWLDLPANIKNNLLTLGTPTHFLDLVHFIKSKNVKVENSYTAICGGANVERNLWHSLKNDLNISNPSIGYGCTEASLAVTHLPPGIEPLEDNELGIPINGITTSLQDEGVKITGDSVCVAMIYEDHMEFPDKIIIKDNINIRKSDKIWIYRSRNDLFLNRGGEKFFLEDIQLAIKNELQLENVCVAVKDQRLGHELGVAILKNKTINISELSTSIKSLLKNKYDNKFNNLKICLLDNFPTNSNAKVDRKIIIGLLENGQ